MKRKERIQEKKTKEKSNPSSSTKKKEYIYKYPSSVTKRIENPSGKMEKAGWDTT